MAKRRKDYRVAARPEPLIGTPGPLVVNFLDEGGELAQTFDFSVHVARPQMAAEIALAFRHHHAGNMPATRKGAFHSAGTWFRFLDAHDGNVVAMRQVDEAVLRAFIVWLGRRLPSKGNRYVAWSGVKQLFAWLCRNRPELVHPGLEIPFNPFPRKNAEARQREALERSEIEAVLAAARCDIDASWARFSEGERALAGADRAAIAIEPDLARLDLANHATPDTTQRYVDRPIVRKAQAAALGGLQALFVETVRNGGEVVKVEETAAGIDPKYGTASGFLCSDPLSGIGEGQKPGRLCTAWLGCFTCPNAVIPLETDVLARLLRTRAALADARARIAPDRWRLLYAPKLEIIDRDIVPRFPSAMHAAALARIAAMPAVPPIE